MKSLTMFYADGSTISVSYNLQGILFSSSYGQMKDGCTF